MNYNHFTIDYINAIKSNLKIEIDSAGIVSFFPDKISLEDIVNLKKELQSVWLSSESAILVIKSKHDATIQSGLFGLVNDLDAALKIGFLLGDRVVLVDYLFERMLADPDKVDKIRLGVIASSLVNTLPLAEKGRIVIIPNPFNWNPDSKKIIREIAENGVKIGPDLMSLINMLSITKICKLHPYTIAESENVYSAIINDQLDYASIIGMDGGKYAYDGILGALLSEKLLQETELKVALDLPLSRYFEIVSSNQTFYLKYLTEITAGGSLSGQNNIDNIRNEVIKSNENITGKLIANSITSAAIVGGVGSGLIRVAAAIVVVSSHIQFIGAALGLSSVLLALFKKQEKEEQPIISVFKKLYNA